MKVSLRQRIGALVLDVPRYYFLRLRQLVTGNPYWLWHKNRRDQVEVNPTNFGVLCNWKWTNDLYLPKIFPRFGQGILDLALEDKPIAFASHRIEPVKFDVSFIIGHRGKDRLPLLHQTLKSIAAQEKCAIECIVVEQSEFSSLEEELPDWVVYKHQRVDASTPYSRAMAFNFGAGFARSAHLILHDNDLLIPKDYAAEHLRWLQKGHDFVNLKRYIFYLDEESTHTVIDSQSLAQHLKIESIMQNAQGGGSVAAKKRAYYDIGGFDNRFIGWGGEDNEFWERAKTKKVWSYADSILVHLWHSAQSEKANIEASDNNRLYNTLSKLDAIERIDTLRKLNNLPCDNENSYC